MGDCAILKAKNGERLHVGESKYELDPTGSKTSMSFLTGMLSGAVLAGGVC